MNIVANKVISNLTALCCAMELIWREWMSRTTTAHPSIDQKYCGELHDGDESTFLAGRFRVSSKAQEETRKRAQRDVRPIARAIYRDVRGGAVQLQRSLGECSRTRASPFVSSCANTGAR